MNPLISILIPCYNSSKFIGKTIESAINQSWGNKEIIIIDDGSTDNSVEVINQYLSDQVRLIVQENKGACAARNTGISHSKGDYIQFLDADDLLSRKKIESQIDLITGRGEDVLASCSWKKISQEDIVEEDCSCSGIFKDYADPIDLLMEMWDTGQMMQTAVWLTSRSLIERAGNWDESLSINQDGEFFCRVIMQARQIVYTENSSVFYRSNVSGSITNEQSTFNKSFSLLKSYRSYSENVLKHRDNDEVRRVLAKNYYSFIYTYFDLYPELVEQAVNSIRELGDFAITGIGGKRFQRLANLVGFWTALKLRHIVRS